MRLASGDEPNDRCEARHQDRCEARPCGLDDGVFFRRAIADPYARLVNERRRPGIPTNGGTHPSSRGR